MKRSAPPTDDELLKQRLLSASLLPPPTTASPGVNGHSIVPPKDVQLAVAMSRANILSLSPPISRKGLLSLSNPDHSVISTDQEDNGPSTPTTSSSSNSYSIGRNLPPGVSWRYVNILDDDNRNTSK